MDMIKKLIISLLLISPALVANENFIDSVGLNLGYSKIYSEQENKLGEITLDKKLDEDYLHAELFMTLGLFNSKNYKATLNYMLSNNDEFTNNTLLVGLNRYFLYSNHDIYMGLLVGGGMQKWKQNPLNTTTKNDYKASSIVGALQVGIEYKLTQRFLFGLNAKYFMHDYVTEFEPYNHIKAEISNENSFSLSVGIRYRFED